MGNQGTSFLRKVWKSEEGQARIPRVNVASVNEYELSNSISYLSESHIRYEFNIWLKYLSTVSFRLHLQLLAVGKAISSGKTLHYMKHKFNNCKCWQNGNKYDQLHKFVKIHLHTNYSNVNHGHIWFFNKNKHNAKVRKAYKGLTVLRTLDWS